MKELDREKISKIIISRTDSIGDVMLTLPLAAWLKENTKAEIYFLGKKYTQTVIENYDKVDHFLDWDEIINLPSTERSNKLAEINADVIIHVFPNKEVANIAKKAKIPYRIGTSHRGFHLLTCNIRLNFTRKNSALHEAQLNFELLKPFGLDQIPTIDEIQQWTKHFKAKELNLPAFLNEKLEKQISWVIFHPKSQGSAVEWPIEKYMDLANKLLNSGMGIIFTGTEKEGEQFRNLIPKHENCIDSTGKLSLDELITLISKVKALVACSTGPLHIAGFLGIHTLGLFSPRKPIHPGRWKALGKHVHIFVADDNCATCKKGKNCNCIQDISVEKLRQKLVNLN